MEFIGRRWVKDAAGGRQTATWHGRLGALGAPRHLPMLFGIFSLRKNRQKSPGYFEVRRYRFFVKPKNAENNKWLWELN